MVCQSSATTHVVDRCFGALGAGNLRPHAVIWPGGAKLVSGRAGGDLAPVRDRGPQGLALSALWPTVRSDVECSHVSALLSRTRVAASEAPPTIRGALMRPKEPKTVASAAIHLTRIPRSSVGPQPVSR